VDKRKVREIGFFKYAEPDHVLIAVYPATECQELALQLPVIPRGGLLELIGALRVGRLSRFWLIGHGTSSAITRGADTRMRLTKAQEV
jgi:hypothetical protein